MSKMVKVVCECSGVTPEGGWDEGNLKVAEIRSDWENTSSGWKAFHILMCIPTGAVWVGLILAKMFFIYWYFCLLSWCCEGIISSL